jgi:amidohydrolase
MVEESDVKAAKERVAEEIRQLHPRLIDISQTLHAHPELLFQEHKAVALLTTELAQQGFEVKRGVAGLETAFVATYGEGTPRIALLAEYDALPNVGHACGHNLIATWAVGAGIALRHALPDSRGTVQVIGTPAEEGGGGKVTMAEQGIFRGLDAAMMIHPACYTFLDRGSLGMTPYTLEFFGKASHAAAAPERGISALDAVLQVFYSINALRQLLKPDARIHGIITHGGDAANIIPAYAAAKFQLRSQDQTYLEEMKAKFLRIVEAAALATGARFQVSEGISYQQRVCNQVLAHVFGENVTALGFEYETPPDSLGVGSSDIGNVSQLVPTIHPYLKICEPGISGHSKQFAEAAATPLADKLTASGATMLAWTATDVLLRPNLRERLRATFCEQFGREPQGE